MQTNTNALPREVTLDRDLKHLLYFPIEEIARLRSGAVAGALGPTRFPPGAAAAPLAPWAQQTEARVTFKLAPSGVGSPQRVELLVMGVALFLELSAAGDAAVAGFDSSAMSCPSTCPGCTNRTRCPAANATLPIKVSLFKNLYLFLPRTNYSYESC